MLFNSLGFLIFFPIVTPGFPVHHARYGGLTRADFFMRRDRAGCRRF